MPALLISVIYLSWFRDPFMAYGAEVFNSQYYFFPQLGYGCLPVRPPPFLLPRGVYSLVVLIRAFQTSILNPGSYTGSR